MALTAGELLTRLGAIIKQDKSQADQARYLLPFILLMRLDTKLEPTRVRLREISGDWDKAALAADTDELCLEAQEARQVTGQYFYNLGPYCLSETKDSNDVLTRLEALVRGFSPFVRSLLVDELDVVGKAQTLHRAKVLYGFVGELVGVQRETASLDDNAFGLLLSDLLQLLSEGTNDDASECATPRDVVDLMVALLSRPPSAARQPRSLIVYDPTYGTAGLLIRAAAHLHEQFGRVDVSISGHEKRAEMHALGALAALLQVSTFNRQAPEDTGALGSVVDLVRANVLKPQARRRHCADYAVCNPPQGSSGKWGDIQDTVLQEAALEGSRFGAGTPAVTDATLLFVQHIIDRLKPTGRAVLVLNGSPLFAGQVSANGRNEQAIRTWLLTKDYVDAIVALPPNVHFNTDIPTYIWVLDKQRPESRKGRVVLVNAYGRPGTAEERPTCFAVSQRKNQNKKRFQLAPLGIAKIVDMVDAFVDVDGSDEEGKEVPVARVVATSDFRFRVVKVHRPLRRRVTIDLVGIARLSEQEAWSELEDADRDSLLGALESRIGYENADAGEFDAEFKAWAKEAGLRAPKQGVCNAVLAALSERDPTAVPVRNSTGNLVSDPELADEERIPWAQETGTYIDREVRPFVPEEDRDLLWTSPRELPGAEIPFGRIFYRYREPRSLVRIGWEIRAARAEVDSLLDAWELELAATDGPVSESDSVVAESATGCVGGSPSSAAPVHQDRPIDAVIRAATHVALRAVIAAGRSVSPLSRALAKLPVFMSDKQVAAALPDVLRHRDAVPSHLLASIEAASSRTS